MWKWGKVMLNGSIILIYKILRMLLSCLKIVKILIRMWKRRVDNSEK
jgi:hypothetical protein